MSKRRRQWKRNITTVMRVNVGGRLSLWLQEVSSLTLTTCGSRLHLVLVPVRMFLFFSKVQPT